MVEKMKNINNLTKQSREYLLLASSEYQTKYIGGLLE